MKKILTLLTLWLVTISAQAQCPLPTYSWQSNKNRFVISAPQFTPDLYRWQWKEATSNVWTSKDAKLHAVSSPNCKNNQPCTYTVGVGQSTLPSQLWYGIQNGWVVRFARQCSDGTWSAFSAEETVNNVH